MVREATGVVAGALGARAKAITVQFDAASLNRIDELVEAELFPDRGAATGFLVTEGIKANTEMLAKVRDGLDAIRRAEEQSRRVRGEAEPSISTRKEAIAALTKAVARHEELLRSTVHASESLFNQRKRAAREVVERIEAYVNRLANSPKEFERTVAGYRVEASRFDNDVERLERALAQSTLAGSAAGGAGVLAGAGVAALAPSAALAVATTFGTASTGTAISTLSGAAATNAALAWLGGGALAAGGGGMAAGNALLALAGPVGLTVAGFALVASAVYLHARNKRCTVEANQKRAEVEVGIRSLTMAKRATVGLSQLIRKHADGSQADLVWLTEHAPANYGQFDDDQKKRLTALINNIGTLGKLLGEQVTCGSA